MDQFIKINKHKNYNIFGRADLTNEILKKINNKDVFCIYGNSGVGKTFLISEILKNFSSNEICHDILRSKNETIKFIDKVKVSFSHLFIDNIDTDFYGWKELVEHIKSGKKISNGSLIIISRNIDKIDFCQSVHVPPLKDNEMIELGRKRYPKIEYEDVLKICKKSRGNLRNFFDYFEFPDEKDIFFTPKEVVHNLLCASELNPSDYIGRTVEDHGYSWGIVHENYPRSSIIDIHEAFKIADCMSLADIYDNYLYEGEWDLSPYFCHEGIVTPTIKLKQSLCRETLNPGSSWTKYNNYKMRKGKLKEMAHHQGKFGVDMDELMLVRDKCQNEKIGVVPFLIENNYTSQDMDVINHLALLNKIKPKLLTNIKKELKKHEASKRG